MADLEQMKKGWKVLDENLQKSEIINQEQIKKITMEKIKKSTEIWLNKNKEGLILSIIFCTSFTIAWYIEGRIWQSVIFPVTMLPFIIIEIMDRKKIKNNSIYNVSISDFLYKMEDLRFDKFREFLYSISFLIFSLFILISTYKFRTEIHIDFIIIYLCAFFWRFVITQRRFSELHKNILELKKLQEESE